MEYNFSDDLRAIREILKLTQEQMAAALGVERVTITRNEAGKTTPSSKLLEQVYHFAYEKGIQLNRLKEMLHRENLTDNHILLFHGAKDEIVGELDGHRGRDNNDFGQGFYAGETYLQAVSFVAGYPKSSVYLLDFSPDNLQNIRYGVDREWMLTIAYFRGKLGEYKEHPIVKKHIAKIKNADYIIAPIADNKMFQIIDSFIIGELTDEQCKYCLAATNLGFQYVFRSEKAIRNLRLVERCYVPENERTHYRYEREKESRLGDDKVKLARINYRGKGKYIDEILK